MINIRPVCFDCKHFDVETSTCAAFKNIPDDILSGVNDHSEPYPGDDGFLFEPKETSDG